MANPTDIELQDLTIVQEVKYVPNDVNNEEKTTLQTMWLKLQFDPRKQRNLLVAIGVFAALIILAIFITLGVVLSQTEDLINDKLLVIAGYQIINYSIPLFNYSFTSKTELIDLRSSSSASDEYYDLPDWPYETSCGVGFVTSQGIQICGGHNHQTAFKTTDCVLLDSKLLTFDKVDSMTEARSEMTYVILENESVWMMGGWDGNRFINSTEIVSITGAEPSVDLPIHLGRQCLIHINQTHVLITGGITLTQDKKYAHVDKTYFINLVTRNISDGPTLLRCPHQLSLNKPPHPPRPLKAIGGHLRTKLEL